MPPGEPKKTGEEAEAAAKAHAGNGHEPLEDLERKFHSGEAQAAGAATPDGLGQPSDPDDQGEDEADRLLRSSALGRRLAKRRGYAVRAREPKVRRLLSSWGLGGVLLLAVWSAVGAWPLFAWWLSAAAPVNLGHLGAYDLTAAQDGAFARVEGIASPKRGTYSRFLGQHELFPLIASRILVDRAGEPDDSARGLAFRYSGEGRLHRADAEGKWAAVREQFYSAGELAKEGDIWVLEDGVVPRRGLRTPLEFALWVGLAAVCAVVLALRLKARLRE